MSGFSAEVPIWKRRYTPCMGTFDTSAECQLGHEVRHYRASVISSILSSHSYC